MNSTAPASFVPELTRDLRAFAVLCEETLALASREHQALAGNSDYQPFEFYQSRKNLLGRLDPLMIEIQHWRQIWQQCSPLERASFSGVKVAVQMLQDLIMRILQLDRENQQALLRRGLVPARHVNSFAAPPSNYVANLYRRNTHH
ncbi:MAG TPA: hypothetical protein VL970_06515 [Candidatus Acidoferrales bacterium]|nr:hypothetical protein [Candidatus Acidoferrales bacterium]